MTTLYTPTRNVVMLPRQDHTGTPWLDVTEGPSRDACRKVILATRRLHDEIGPSTLQTQSVWQILLHEAPHRACFPERISPAQSRELQALITQLTAIEGVRAAEHVGPPCAERHGGKPRLRILLTITGVDIAYLLTEINQVLTGLVLSPD